MRFISHVAICLAAQVVLAVSAADAAGGRPSEGDIRACVANTEQGRVYGAVLRFEFGKTFTSQGGMIEMAMGAPQGTPIFPTKLYFPGGWVGVAWIFQDPFGAWKCERNGDMKKGPDPKREAAKAGGVKGKTSGPVTTTDVPNSFPSWKAIANGTSTTGLVWAMGGGGPYYFLCYQSTTGDGYRYLLYKRVG